MPRIEQVALPKMAKDHGKMASAEIERGMNRAEKRAEP
jgi:hypothetical protein